MKKAVNPAKIILIAARDSLSAKVSSPRIAVFLCLMLTAAALPCAGWAGSEEDSGMQAEALIRRMCVPHDLPAMDCFLEHGYLVDDDDLAGLLQVINACAGRADAAAAVGP